MLGVVDFLYLFPGGGSLFPHPGDIHHCRISQLCSLGTDRLQLGLGHLSLILEGFLIAGHILSCSRRLLLDSECLLSEIGSCLLSVYEPLLHPQSLLLGGAQLCLSLFQHRLGLSDNGAARSEALLGEGHLRVCIGMDLQNFIVRRGHMSLSFGLRADNSVLRCSNNLLVFEHRRLGLTICVYDLRLSFCDCACQQCICLDPRRLLECTSLTSSGATEIIDLTHGRLRSVTNRHLDRRSEVFRLCHELVRRCAHLAGFAYGRRAQVLGLERCGRLLALDLECGRRPHRLDLCCRGQTQLRDGAVCCHLDLRCLAPEACGVRLSFNTLSIGIIDQLACGMLGLAATLLRLCRGCDQESVGFVLLAIGFVTELLGLLPERLRTVLCSLQRLGCGLFSLSCHRLQILELCLAQDELCKSRLCSLLGFIEQAESLLLDLFGIRPCLIAKSLCLRRQGIGLCLSFGRGLCHLALGLRYEVFDPFRSLFVGALDRPLRGLLGHQQHFLDAFLGFADRSFGLCLGGLHVKLCSGDKRVSLGSDLFGSRLGIGDDRHRLLLNTT